MTSDPDSNDSRAATAPAPQQNRSIRRKWLLGAMLLLVAVWAVAAYMLVPWLWEVYFWRHPAWAKEPRITHTADGHPGDPLNIGLVGTDEQVIHAMTTAGWYPADPITFRSSVRIVVDSVFRRPDDEAPVSSLYLFGRKQDLAFEQPVGDSPRQRHHVRFWRSTEQQDGRPLWLGAATFDERVGLSHTTGQVTHHIGPDVDAERNRIADELEKARWVQKLDWIDGFHRQLEGRNGGGDPWHTDGRLAVVALQERRAPPVAE